MKLKFLLISFVIAQFTYAQSNTEIKEISRNGYTISYPSNLRLDESKKGTEFYLLTEKTSSYDHFIENINLVIQNLEGANIDLDKFVEITTNQLREKGKITKSKRIKSGKNEFHMFVCERSVENFELKHLQYDFVKDDLAYVITFTATKDDYSKYLPTMKKVMDSFKLN